MLCARPSQALIFRASCRSCRSRDRASHVCSNHVGCEQHERTFAETTVSTLPAVQQVKLRVMVCRRALHQAMSVRYQRSHSGLHPLNMQIHSSGLDTKIIPQRVVGDCGDLCICSEPSTRCRARDVEQFCRSSCHHVTQGWAYKCSFSCVGYCCKRVSLLSVDHVTKLVFIRVVTIYVI